MAGSHVLLDVHVIVRFGEHIPTLARLLRRRISEHVVSLTGLTPSEINIAVSDVEAQAASYGD